MNKMQHSKIQIYQTILNEETIKTKVVDLKDSYNFVFGNFFYLKSSIKKNHVWISHIFQTISDGETTKTKVIDLNDIYNSVVWKLFYLNSFRVPNSNF